MGPRFSKLKPLVRVKDRAKLDEIDEHFDSVREKHHPHALTRDDFDDGVPFSTTLDPDEDDEP